MKLSIVPLQSRRHLEKAGQAVSDGRETLSQGIAAAVLTASYRFLGAEDAAGEWDTFYMGLPCPDETKGVFQRRAELVFARCDLEGRLVVV